MARGVDVVSKAETIRVDDRLLGKIRQAVDAALSYEQATKGTRKLGITGEVGELLACHQLGLDLVIDSRSEGVCFLFSGKPGECNGIDDDTSNKRDYAQTGCRHNRQRYGCNQP